jgi:hypothetical protein
LIADCEDYLAPGVAWHNRVPPSLAVRRVVPVTYGMVRRKEAFTTVALAGNVGVDVTASWFSRQSTDECRTADNDSCKSNNDHVDS